MRRLVRWILRLAAALVLLALVVLLAKDIILKEIVQWRVRQETGCDVSIGHFELSLLKPTLFVEDFRLYNRPEFGGGVFISVPELRVEYDPDAMSHRELHLISAVINVAELNIVHGPGERSNLDAMTAGSTSKPDEDEAITFTGIDTLTLSLGTIRESRVNEGLLAEQNLGITNRVLHHVRSTGDLAPLLIDVLLKQAFSNANRATH